jgi:hypothetical protein
MKNGLTWLGLAIAVVLTGSFAWMHRHTLAMDSAAAASDGQQSYAEEQEAHQAVTVSAPLADYVVRQNGQKTEAIETLQPVSYRPNAADQAGDARVGTGSELLGKTFAVASIVDVPFELPAHASSPQLHGAYKSFVQSSGVQQAALSESAADVEFLLFNEKQYADFLTGRPADAIFSADASHDQEVNVTMSPTFNQPVKYFLVFRNPSLGAEKTSEKTLKKFVQVDFRLDF